MFERRLNISSAILAGLSVLCAVSPAPRSAVRLQCRH